MTILDKEALIDARRSLSVMLYDFLSQHKYVTLRESEVITCTCTYWPYSFVIQIIDFTSLLSSLLPSPLTILFSSPPSYSPSFSLSYTFPSFCRPKLTESEKRKLVTGLDMRPISEEYERELRYVLYVTMSNMEILSHS